MEEKRYHFSPEMIARLFGVPPEKKETEESSKSKHEAITKFSNKNIIIEKSGPLTRTLEPESVLDDKRSMAPQIDPENNYTTGGVLTVGIIMTVVGILLLSSQLVPPSIYSFVGGMGFFILGLSVIGAGIIRSAEKQGG